jgi:diguanylate cyclase (GGDEF)-like protein
VIDRRDGGSADADVTEQLLAFVEKTSDLVGVVDEQSRVRYLNEAARKHLGVGDAADLTTLDLFPPQAFARYYEEIRPALLRSGTWRGELPVIGAAGDIVPMAMTIVATVGPGGEVSGLVTHGREIETPPTSPGGPSVAYDELTGLPGRTILDDRVRGALARTRRDGRGIAVIAVDIDSMKDINDSFGRAVGDDVLSGVGRALSRCLRAGETVACFGGDDFIVLVDRIDGAETPQRFAERLRDAVRRVPVDTRIGALSVTVSVGLVVGVAGDTPAELLRRADTAMRRAKAMGHGKIVEFEEGSELSVTTLADELAVAVSHGLIKPHVQSIVNLHDGVLVGYQGLAHWEHPVHGLLRPDQFIDVVANAAVLPVVDLAVLRRTVAAAARTSRSGTRVRAYGHLSRRLLGDIGLTRYLTEIVDDLGVAPSSLGVEISHHLLARPSRTIASALRDVRAAGVRTVLSAVDGDCEVNQIVEYGFDEFRLARRLVRDAGRDPARRRVAHGIIALARTLGLTVTAVGIESDAERVDLRDAGCDYGQGNLFGPARPAGSID